MKTSIRIIAIFIVLVFITSDSASGQSRVNNQNSIITEPPVSQTPQPATTSANLYTPPWSGSSSEPSDPQKLLDTLANYTRSSRSTGTRTGSENILIIPTEEVGFEELLKINEDMNVMSKILQNELNQQPKAILGDMMFIDNRWVPSYESILGRRTNNSSCMYLQGYGALFMMEVDFPLSGSPETQQQEETEAKEDVDEVWEQTKQQIYQPQVGATTSQRRVAERPPEVKYDAQQVENLKTTLIESLKHAANIRALAPDESVIIKIDGSGRSITVLSVAKQENGGWLIDFESDGTRKMMSIDLDINDFVKRFSVPTCIDIRAKKSDIDAFAKGGLDFDQFREKVQVLSYPLLSGNTRGTSVTRSPRSTGRTSTFTTP